MLFLRRFIVVILLVFMASCGLTKKKVEEGKVPVAPPLQKKERPVEIPAQVYPYSKNTWGRHEHLWSTRKFHRRPRFITTPPDPDEVARAVLEFSVPLYYEKELRLKDSFITFDTVRGAVLHLDFYSQDMWDLCEARELLVYVVENMIERLNVATSYFFLPPQLVVKIHSEGWYGEYIDTWYTEWIILENGIVYYYAFDLYDQEPDVWHCHREYYNQSALFAHTLEFAEEDYLKEHPEMNPGGTLEQFLETQL